MESKIIIMLTHNDQTVKNALEVFDSCKDLPVDFWGFKDVGYESCWQNYIPGSRYLLWRRVHGRC